MKHTYWVSRTDQNIKEPGRHRVNPAHEKWAGLKVGDPMEITYVPGDPEPYVRGSIFDSEGNSSSTTYCCWRSWRGPAGS